MKKNVFEYKNIFTFNDIVNERWALSHEEKHVVNEWNMDTEENKGKF